MRAHLNTEQSTPPGKRAMEKLAISVFSTVALMAVATTVLTDDGADADCAGVI
jgi:hypothetical protein